MAIATRRNPRWLFRDPATGEEWRLPFNPNQMTSPHRPDNIRIFTASADVAATGRGSVARVLAGKREPYEWSFTGVIREEEHHEQLVAWARKKTKIHVTDHLGRTWEVRLLTFDLEERRPTRRRDWRFQYTMRAMMHGQVS